jgi:putative peptidoglycan lipid II flippase
VINRILASGLGSGNISSLDYAGKVAVIINSVFIYSLATVLYPSYAKNSDNLGSFTLIFAKSMRMVSLITIPLVAGLIVLKTPVVQILFQRGAFSSENTRVTADTLAIMSIGIIGVGFREFLNRAFFALKDTRTPMINGLIAISLNIIFNITFVRIMGIYGLALGTTLSSLVSSGMLVVRIKHKLNDIRGQFILDGFIRSLSASVIMGIIVYFLEGLLSAVFSGSTLMRLINVTICAGTGFLVYAVLLYLLKVDEIRSLMGHVRNKILRHALGG